jgi:outer membrane lipoprotein-sorting protein
LIKSFIFLFLILILNSLNLISCDVSKIEKFLDENVRFQVSYEQNFSDSSDSIEGNIYRDNDNIKVFSLSPREELLINGKQIFRHDLEMDQLIIQASNESMNQSPAFLLFNKPNAICDFFSATNCTDESCKYSDPLDNFYLKNIEIDFVNQKIEKIVYEDLFERISTIILFKYEQLDKKVSFDPEVSDKTERIFLN